jgi:flotillin
MPGIVPSGNVQEINFMHEPISVILAGTIIMVCLFIVMGILLSRYTKVGPNQVLVVSGAKRRLPDGTCVGYRIIKGGGTIVLPVIEKADVLSLEVIAVEMRRVEARTADGRTLEADAMAQVKIKGDDPGIAAAVEYFLNQGSEDMKNIVRPVLEKHLLDVLGAGNGGELEQNPAGCATRVQSAALTDLGKMGLEFVSFTVRSLKAR